MSIVARLLLLFTLLPIIEISLLIPLHNAVGGLATFGIICFTALAGTGLTKWQGTAALTRIKETVNSGGLPGEDILDGVLILVAGVTLITPGVLTDSMGLLLLLPPVRRPVRAYIKKRGLEWIKDKGRSSAVHVHSYSTGGGQPEPYSAAREPGVIDITPAEAEAAVES
jgi:UPF0716 protein FxsA